MDKKARRVRPQDGAQGCKRRVERVGLAHRTFEMKRGLYLDREMTS
jgi:hypothetical protein